MTQTTGLTWVLLSHSDFSILCGPQQTWRPSQQHIQLLPEHRGGHLSGSLVSRERQFPLCPVIKIIWKFHIGRRWCLLSEWSCSLFIWQQQTTWKASELMSKAKRCFVPDAHSVTSLLSHRHTLPASQWEQAVGKSPEWYQRTLGDGSPVIIYLHGNGGNRCGQVQGDRNPWTDANRVLWVLPNGWKGSECIHWSTGSMPNVAQGLTQTLVCLCFLIHCDLLCRAMKHRVELMKVRPSIYLYLWLILLLIFYLPILSFIL